jgi:hypothetical protein
MEHMSGLHEQNNRILKAKEFIVLQILEKVKVLSLWWMRAFNVNFDLNSHLWWSSPSVYMGIG